MSEIRSEIRIEEVRFVKGLVVSFLQGFNYAKFDNAYDYTEFHDAVVDNDIDLSELATELYYLNTFEWTNQKIYKELVIESIPSLEYALQGKHSGDKLFYKTVEVENGFEEFYRDDMFRIYPIKTRQVFEIIEKLDESALL